VAAWALILVHIFEAPRWTYQCEDAANQDLFPGYGIPSLPVTVACALNIFFLIILCAGVALENAFENSQSRRRLIMIMQASILLKLIESFISLGLRAAGKAPLSLSPVEAMFIILVERKYMTNLPYLIRVMPPFAFLITVLAAVVCIYTAFGYLIFDPGSQEIVQYFPDYGNAVWNMLMVLNGSNWPTPMIPAFQQNWLYCMYFVLYLVIGNWGFLNLTLGFIFASFQIEMDRIKVKQQLVKETNLLRAFKVLDWQNKGYLTPTDIEPVIEYLYHNFESSVTKPPTLEERLGLAGEMNTKRDGKIDSVEFLQIREKCFDGGALKDFRLRMQFARTFSVASLSNMMSSLNRTISASFSLGRTQSTDPAQNSGHPFNNVNNEFRQSSLTSVPEDSGDDAFLSSGEVPNPLVSPKGASSSSTTNRQNSFRTTSLTPEVHVYPTKPGVNVPRHGDNSSSSSDQCCNSESEIVARTRQENEDSNVEESYHKMSVQEVFAMDRPRNAAEFIVYVARVIDSVFYDLMMDTLICLVGLILFATSSTNIYYWYMAMCLVEGLTKLFLKGFYRFRRSYRNAMNGLLTLLLVACTIRMNSRNRSSRHDYRFAVQTVVVLRFIFYPLNLLVLERFAVYRRKYMEALRFVTSGATDFYFLVLLLFVFIYAFASLGVQLFGGMIRKYGDNYDRIADSYYGQQQYWPLNFNDMLSGMSTMYILLHVNNMHVTASGFTAVVGDTAYIFFSAWYVMGVLLMLNVVIAFFLSQLIKYVSQRDQKSLNTEVVSADRGSQDQPVGDTENDQVIIDSNATGGDIDRPAGIEKQVSLNRRSVAQAMPPIPEVAISEQYDESLGIRAGVDSIGIPPPDSGQGDSQQSSPVPNLPPPSSLLPPLPTVRPIRKRSLAGPAPPPPAEIEISSPPMGKSSKKHFGASLYASGGTRERLATLVESEYADYRLSLASNAASHATTPAVSYSHRPLDSGTNEPESSGNLASLDNIAAEGNNTNDANDASTGGTLSLKMVVDSLLDNEHHHLRRELHSSMKDWVAWRTQLEPHEAAAVLIQYARDGGHYTLFSTQSALTCYRYRQKLAMLFRVCCWCLLFLKVFERPYWTSYTSDWQSSDYPKSGISYLTPQAAVAIKLPLTCILMLGLLLEYGYKENGKLTVSYLSPMVVVRYSLMLFCFVQCVVLLYVGISGKQQELVVLSSLGTCFYVFWFDKRAFVRFKLIAQLVPAFSCVLLGFLCLVLFFASMGPYIFNECSSCDDDDFNRSQFQTLPDSVWSVFVAITSSSYPGQVMPLYRRTRAFFLYFVAFISLGAYGVLNLCLVVVLYQYNRKAQIHADHVSAATDILMLRAFQVLDVQSKGYLEYAQVRQVLAELYTHYADFRKAGVPSGSKQHLLVKIMDMDGDGKISAADFAHLIDVTRIKLKMDEDITYMELNCPTCAQSSHFSLFVRVITSRSYMIAIDIIVVSLMLADLALTPDIYSLHSVRRYYGLKITALAVLGLNSLVSYVAWGHRAFMKKTRNTLDLFIFSSFLFVVVGFALTKDNAPLYAGIAVYGQLIEIVRVLLFPRVLRALLPQNSYRLLVHAIKRIIRSVYTLYVVFVCAFFAMCNIGMFVFGGRVNTSPAFKYYEALNTSQYGLNDFWTLNFNDMPNAFVTLFCCLHVSDFDVITSGFVAITSTYARIFFTAWYVIGVLLLLNIVKSYFLSGHLMEAVTQAMNYQLPRIGKFCCWWLPESTSQRVSMMKNNRRRSEAELAMATAASNVSSLLDGLHPEEAVASTGIVSPSTGNINSEAQTTGLQQPLSDQDQQGETKFRLYFATHFDEPGTEADISIAKDASRSFDRSENAPASSG
jgi:hypothetical protein